MALTCRECKRLNPDEAEFCFFDGIALSNGAVKGDGASVNFATWAFPMPFVFPSGTKCQNFLQLAMAFKKSPDEASEVLQQGFLDGFFGGIGRVDLALAARNASKVPDRERGLDDLLGKLPGSPLQPGKLEVEPTEQNLGVIQVGEDRKFDLVLTNKGDRLLYGKVTVEACPWIVFGDSGAPEKLFQFFDSTTIPVTIKGKALRALSQSQKAEISVESNTGTVTVTVTVMVPVKPFAQGALSGATSPRQLAEKAKANPKEAAVLLETGAVARWYEANGWTYPVQGQSASGIAAVQQFFEMLGLVKPPKVEMSEMSVTLSGKPGERVEYVVTALTQEKKPAWAQATSDQPWLNIGKIGYKGQTASIPLIIEAIPGDARQTVQAQVKVTANGNQRFDIPISLKIGDAPPGYIAPAPRPNIPAPTATPSHPEVIPVLSVAPMPETIEEVPVLQPTASPIKAIPPSPVVSQPMTPTTPVTLAPATTAPVSVEKPPAKPGERREKFFKYLPVAIVVLGLLTAVIRDMFMREKPDEPLPEIDWANPVIAVNFHDKPGEIEKIPSMRFGLGIPDPKKKDAFQTRLVFDDMGQTCNVVLKFNRSIVNIFGKDGGQWKGPMKELLGKDRDGNRLIGAKSTWVRTAPPLISVTQIVEVVPGGLSDDGKKRLLDTCLVQYQITNEDSVQHSVGLRFMLDTYIGNNDAVPFTIAGAKELCDTMKSFNKEKDVPDYIAALENQNLNKPGTVAYLNLRYGAGLEPPTRVTLGAWPAPELRKQPGGSLAQMQNTLWDVPVLPMELAKSEGNPNGDSAVTMYWDEKDLASKETRKVGFAYGLGQVTGDQSSGQLGITAGGELVQDKEFTLTAYVKTPAPGTTITLKLPKGLNLVGESRTTESVPVIPPGSTSAYSPVTWRVKAIKSGVLRVKVELSGGASIQYKVLIKPKGVY